MRRGDSASEKSRAMPGFLVKLVMVPTGAVYMAVFQLFGGSVTNLGNLHIKFKRLTGQRMIAIDRDDSVGDLDDRDHAWTLIRLGMELHARLDIVFGIK